MASVAGELEALVVDRQSAWFSEHQAAGLQGAERGGSDLAVTEARTSHANGDFTPSDGK
ncbi:hypothetical protein [Streptomyces sp. NPDC001665]